MMYRVHWTEDHVAYVDTVGRELGYDISEQDIFLMATEDGGTVEDRTLVSVKLTPSCKVLDSEA